MERTKNATVGILKHRYIVLAVIVICAAFLRLYKLDQIPVSLFGDEVDLGYQAFSILKTGKDYSGNFLPVHFHSLAEWRTPLYLYSAVPTVAIFGINAWGVRIPAALFGIATIPVFYFLIIELMRSFKSEENRYQVALIGAVLLTISPWHIQYSRAGFEVTQMIFCLVLGLTLFFVSLRTKGRYLWLAGVCFVLMPWIYSTAKLFTPLLIILLTTIFFKRITQFSKKQIGAAMIAMLILGLPIAYSTMFGEGATRFNYISVFNNITMEPEIGTARGEDALAQGAQTLGLEPTLIDRTFHNKFTYIGDELISNMLTPLSTEFLFIKGDPNPRHSIEGMGEFYRIEVLLLLVGLSYFIFRSDRKIKILIFGWILFGLIPSALTRDGGDHATRLILILPPILFFMSYGLSTIFDMTNGVFKKSVIGLFIILYVFSFASYQHLYWVHNRFQSERWWHGGWAGAISEIKQIDSQFDRVIITTKDEPPWMFFAAFYSYDPTQWQAGYPFKEHVIEGFGKVGFIDKFSFGSPTMSSVYDWGKVLDTRTLFLASAKEVKVNLTKEPERTPNDLRLLKSITYPSGEPAFYLFTKAEK